MPYIKSQSGIKWFYRSLGHGKPLVFIHGWAADSSFWQYQQDFFKRRFRVVVLDLPGHGRSEWKKTDLKTIAKDINHILQALKVTKTTVIGSSLGGLVALKLISLFPQRIEQLVLVGSNAKFAKAKGYTFGLTKKQIRDLYQMLDKSFIEMLEVFFRTLFTYEERKTGGFPRVWSLIRQRKHQPNKEALKALLLLLEKEDVRADLKKITARSLIINGKKDYIASPGSSHYLKKKIKKARLEILEDCGHIPFMTQPQTFNQIVNNFLYND
ncbi:alpha/beta fold hydrolase [Candidatus Omnitrophota bacterium]